MTSRRLVVSLRARRDLNAARAWWLRNRDKAPAAFDENVSDALKRIVDQPLTGTPVRSRNGRTLRRYLAERIRYYIYYRVTEREVGVITVWHASRRPPKL